MVVLAVEVVVMEVAVRVVELEAPNLAPEEEGLVFSSSLQCSLSLNASLCLLISILRAAISCFLDSQFFTRSETVFSSCVFSGQLQLEVALLNSRVVIVSSGG